MIGKVVKVGKDGNVWWRQDTSTTHNHLRNWKMMLWVVASLLPLVDGVFTEEDTKEATLDSFPSANKRGPLVLWRSASHPEVHELGEESNQQHASWPLTLFEDPGLQEEGEAYQSRWQRSPPDSAPPRGSRKNRQRIRNSRDCRMAKKEMRVRDLGMGFDSDEIVLFKYCVGTCHSARGNYDLALKALMANGSISNKKVSANPCCRPSRYETVSFMDTQAVWQTIRWLSAANCSCVG